jgi:LCP family protein required for cell wall assembly
VSGDHRTDGGPDAAQELFERLRRLPPVERPPLPTGWGAEPPEPRPSAPVRTRAAAPSTTAAPAPAPAVPGSPRQYFVPADVADRAPAPVLPPPPGPPGTPPPGRGRPTVPPPGGSPAGRGRARRRRRIAAAAGLVLLALVVGMVGYGLVQYRGLERVAVGDALSPAGGGGTNYLIVGSDSREGFDPNDPNAGAVLGDDTTSDGGERSDTMLVLRVQPDGALMMSIPRDLWVTRADGTTGRINAAYREGPANLIRTVRGSLGVPVHRYVEVDFVTFAGLVDAVAGVTIEIPHPARDDRSGLDLPTAGRVELDGVQALAFVRSRHYTELIDGSWVTDPTGDLGRVQRQQQFLRAVMGEVGGSRNPIELMRVSSAVAGGLRVDDRMGLLDSLAFARRMRGLDPESVVLPVAGRTTSGGAAVLDLVQPDAGAVLARMGAGS